MRNATPKAFRFKEKGTADPLTEILADRIAGDISWNFDNPTEDMASGLTREVGYQMTFSIPIKVVTRISAYKKLHIGAAAATGDPGAPGASDAWVDHGRLDGDGSIDYTVRSRNDASIMPVYRGGAVTVIAHLLDESQHTAIVAYNNTRRSLALERSDGTFKVFRNLLINYGQLWPQLGTDRSQTIRVRATESAFDVAALSDLNDAAYAQLNTLQQDGKTIEGEVEMLDTTKLLITEAGFTVLPLENYGQASYEGFVINGGGFGVTEGSMIGASPAL